MNNGHNVQNNVYTQLSEADKTKGVERQVLLLSALNGVFETHALDEGDWQGASPESRRRWHRQMAGLLTEMTFCLAGAEAYGDGAGSMTGDLSSMTGDLSAMKDRLTEQEMRLKNIREEKERIDRQLRDAEEACAEMQKQCRRDQSRIGELREETIRYQQQQQKALQEIAGAEPVLKALRTQIMDAEARQTQLTLDMARDRQRVEKLTQENQQMRSNTERQESSITELEYERDLLTDLIAVLKERSKIEDLLGIAVARQLSDHRLLDGMKESHEKIRALLDLSSKSLTDADQFFREEIGMNQRQWETLRSKL